MASPPRLVHARIQACKGPFRTWASSLYAVATLHPYNDTKSTATTRGSWGGATDQGEMV